MNKFKQKCQKIVNKLIDESFPELKKENVKIIVYPKWLIWWTN